MKVLDELEHYRKKHSAVYGDAMTFRDEADYIKYLRGDGYHEHLARGGEP